ncbi:MAG: ABC transporter substrate-binding protein [Thermodesulfobacteriota bacterium]
MKTLMVFILVVLLISFTEIESAPKEEPSIGMAVEFMNHAACAYISQDKGWFEQEGLRVTAYESYVTGMALASALARGDIEVAYICLVPAINVYANAKIPIKIVAGTHKHGYGLVVNPNEVKTVKDLEKPSVRLGCIREGGTVDVLLRKTIDKYHLDKDKILGKVQRMAPPNQVMAIKMGQLDAAFLPEQWATMAEEFAFKMLLTSQDIWPEMQGSVLVVKDELINKHPEMVGRLRRVTQKATEWSNQNPNEAARIMTRQLQAVGAKVFPAEAAKMAANLEITPEVMLRSMSRMRYATDIDAKGVQEIIHYVAGIGYIRNRFNAEDILDLRFVK